MLTAECSECSEIFPESPNILVSTECLHVSGHVRSLRRFPESPEESCPKSPKKSSDSPELNPVTASFWEGRIDISTIQEGDPTAKVDDKPQEENVDNKKKGKGEVESSDEDSDYDIKSVKNKNKGKKKNVSEAHLGIQWDSSEESLFDDEGVATTAMEAHIGKPSLFEDLTDDEDDFTPTCLMEKGTKVDSKSNPNDDDDALDDDECENMIKELGKKASNKIMKLMIEIEGRDGTLEAQEELIRLEREKIIGLEKSLSKERKSFKVQEDLLHAKISKILELEKSLAKEKEKVETLTRDLCLVNESNVNLRSVNESLQEIFSCLHAKHTALEVKHATLLENTTLDSNDATKSSFSTMSNGCARCCNVNVESYATNLADMHVMKNEITRLTSLIKEDKTYPKIGEFEKRTKAFGSGYMKKYGFMKGKGLGKYEQGRQEPIPFIKNNKTSGVGACGTILGGMVPIHPTIDGKQPKASPH
ncbi:uncharacterized protein C2845_PM16G05550 [Panicum miliaceum]|uniref:G-patch domain-containing protein n=1 Tax=Panicum miliaceum TaxID=4540 RepID=A0A3L6PUJ9_PANMI|nr:uncharacterized protein C2845_PM16G05550 [Panicum miliaceum]